LGVGPSLLFKWWRLKAEGGHQAIRADTSMVLRPKRAFEIAEKPAKTVSALT
jgi:transposase-like protein